MKFGHSAPAMTILLRRLGPTFLRLIMLLRRMTSIWFLLRTCIIASSSTTNLLISTSSVNDLPRNTLLPSMLGLAPNATGGDVGDSDDRSSEVAIDFDLG